MAVLGCYFAVAVICVLLWLLSRRYQRLQKLRRYSYVVFLGSLLGGISAWIEITEGQALGKESYIERMGPGKGSEEVRLLLNAEDMWKDYAIDVTVQEQRLAASQLQELFDRAERELDEEVEALYDSATGITSDLKLPGQLQKGLVTVRYTYDNYEILDNEGNILWENLEETEYLVKITAELSCQDETALYEFYIRITSEVLGEQQRLLLQVKQQLKEENQKTGTDRISLPESIEGHRLFWYTQKEIIHWKLFLLGILGVVILYLQERRKKEQRAMQREKGLIIDYPDIVSQLSLLTGAGMTVSSAFAKMGEGYRSWKESGKEGCRPGYEEILITLYEIQDGVGEIRAYERFGSRCSLQTYRKLSSILIQNVKKGAKGMQQLLDDEAAEAYERRKLLAKQLGEEAGTKLLAPMGLMLVLVFVILLVPAGLSLQL